MLSTIAKVSISLFITKHLSYHCTTVTVPPLPQFRELQAMRFEEWNALCEYPCDSG